MKPEDAEKYWFAQSQLLWSRLKTASVIEAAALTASYKLWSDEHPIAALGLLLVAIILLILVGLLMHRDGQYMDDLRERTKPKDSSESDFPNPKRLIGLRGRDVGCIAIGVLVVCNLLAMFWFCPKRHCHKHKHFQRSQLDSRRPARF